MLKIHHLPKTPEVVKLFQAIGIYEQTYGRTHAYIVDNRIYVITLRNLKRLSSGNVVENDRTEFDLPKSVPEFVDLCKLLRIPHRDALSRVKIYKATNTIYNFNEFFNTYHIKLFRHMFLMLEFTTGKAFHDS
jgi:hypothetical protein